MPLPAPYAPPWKRLGDDLVATLAWLGLKGRELWRRNGDGTLPAPSFWPRRWLALFWPLVLAAVVLAAVALGRAGWAGGARAAVGEEASPPLAREERQTASLPPEEAPPPAGEAPVVEPPEAPTTTAESAPIATEVPPPSEAAEAGPSPEPPPSEAERLQSAWSADDRDGLLAGLLPDPAAATLTLRLEAPFAARSAAQRQRLAEGWQERASGEGYDHLRLEDGRGRLLGRDALVGGGMVLLEPAPGEAPAP